MKSGADAIQGHVELLRDKGRPIPDSDEPTARLVLDEVRVRLARA